MKLEHSTGRDGAGYTELAAYAEQSPEPVVRRERSSSRALVLIPGQGNLSLSFGGADRVVDGPVLVAAGSPPARSAHDGVFSCVEIVLPPWAPLLVFGECVRPENGLVPLADVIGQASDELMDRAHGRSTRDCLLAASTWIDEQLRKQARSPNRRVLHALRLMAESNGRARIAEVASQVGWTTKRLSDRFRDSLGMAPKRYARLIRFEMMHPLVMATDEPLSQIAVACGYADQAHMTREFTELAGMPPGAARQARLGNLLGVGDR